MKIFKWILGLFAAIGGILAIMLIPGGGKRKKIKELKNKIKEVDSSINEKEKENKKIQKNIKSKAKKITELKNKKDNIKVKNVGANQAANFLKNYKKR